MRFSTLAAIAAASLAAACGNDSTLTGPSSTTAVSSTEFFVGRLSPGESRFYSFSTAEAGSVTFMLASVTREGSQSASNDVVGLAFGIPSGFGCRHDRTVATPAGLSAQLNVAETTAGVHCVDVYDTGSLAGPVNFAVRILTTPVAGTQPEPTTTAGSDSFSSIVPVLGSVSHSIPASQPGTLILNLTSLLPAHAIVGMGVGIPRSDGAGCYLSASIDATTGTPPITVHVDPGAFCVRVFDSGHLTAPATFTITTIYP